MSFQIAARQRNQLAAEVTLTASNSNNVVDQIRDGAADLGFIEGPAAPRGLRRRVIGHDTLVLVARPDHPWSRRARTVTAADLNKTPLVSREDGSGTREALTHALRVALGDTHPQALPVIALSTTSAVRAAVLEGAGPAVLSGLAVADDIASGRLKSIPVTGVELGRTLRAIWSGPPTPPAGAVRDLLRHITARR